MNPATSIRIHLLAVLLLLSCGVSAQRVFRDQDPVPADFGKAPGTLLLVRTKDKGVDKALQEVFAENYQGPFKLIDADDVAKPEYADLDKYRYVFNTVIKFVPASGMGSTRMPATNNYTYNVYDRVTQATNALTFDAAAYKGLMKDYAKKLEEVRAAGR